MISLVLPPSLYLGPCSAASSKQFLTSNSITDVLSIGANPSQGGAGRVDGVTYHRLSITDSTTSTISKIADAACEIIDSTITSPSKKGGDNGKILVHCSAGISRMTLKAALGQIIRARPQVSPNPGFLQQLKEMEMELFGVAVSSLGGVDELPRREKDRLALFVEEERELECEAGAAATLLDQMQVSS
ncbi:protein-tyrosine phosphatase-like protein [Russula aff. rugulosa BPL654]|nr:protein-tyrosine phosphatase-like protein [Russula aff. rugulosa BPL654]